MKPTLALTGLYITILINTIPHSMLILLVLECRKFLLKSLNVIFLSKGQEYVPVLYLLNGTVMFQITEHYFTFEGAGISTILVFGGGGEHLTRRNLLLL